jgi:hypothetical protein
MVERMGDKSEHPTWAMRATGNGAHGRGGRFELLHLDCLAVGAGHGMMLDGFAECVAQGCVKYIDGCAGVEHEHVLFPADSDRKSD